MPWLDSTGDGAIDTDDLSSPSRIDVSQRTVQEQNTLQKSADSDGADSGVPGGGFYLILKRDRTITRWKYVGLTEDWAKTVEQNFRDTGAGGYGVDPNSLIESSATRLNNANGWQVQITTDTAGNWRYDLS